MAPVPQLIPCRCPWVKPDNPTMVDYHDREWGVARPLTDDELFELLTLECFQAGLSWETILNKRKNFRRAFRGFRIASVARMGKRDVARLMVDASIVRNRAKIEATLRNAGALRKMVEEFGGFGAFLESRRPKRTRKKARPPGRIPDFTEESVALSRALKKRGFAFVGPTVVYSFLQASGFVNDHVKGCFLAP